MQIRERLPRDIRNVARAYAVVREATFLSIFVLPIIAATLIVLLQLRG